MLFVAQDLTTLFCQVKTFKTSSHQAVKARLNTLINKTRTLHLSLLLIKRVVQRPNHISIFFHKYAFYEYKKKVINNLTPGFQSGKQPGEQPVNRGQPESKPFLLLLTSRCSRTIRAHYRANEDLSKPLLQLMFQVKKNHQQNKSPACVRRALPPGTPAEARPRGGCSSFTSITVSPAENEVDHFNTRTTGHCGPCTGPKVTQTHVLAP